MANARYFRVRTLADLPASSTVDGDIFFVRDTQQIFIWDAVNNVMSEASSQAPVLSVAGKTGVVTLNESDIVNLVSDLAGKAASSHTHPESDVTSLVSDLSTLTSAITSEASSRASADSTLQSNITAEASARSSAVSSEASARSSADTTLQTNIDAKQNSLGFTAEDVANKDTSGTLASNSDTKYPSQKAAKTYVDAETTRATAAEALKLATGVLTAMGAPLPSIKSLRVPTILRTQTTGSADVTLYTVPSGKRATLIVFINNQNAGTRNYQLKFKRGSNTYNLGASVAVLSAASPTSIGNLFNGWPIGDAGDAFLVNVDGATVNLYGVILEWDDTESIKSAILETPVSGNNVVYTCPANKNAILTNFAPAVNAPIRLYNGSGTTRTYKWHSVPSGGSPGTDNLITKATNTVTNNNNSNDTSNMIAIGPGDTIVINLDANAASSLAVVMNIIEIPQ